MYYHYDFCTAISLSKYIGLFSSELSNTKYLQHRVSLSHGLRRSFVDVFKHMFFYLKSFWGCFDVYVLSFHSRSCIPAEAEPLLNSSGCYPLVNFTRPFCKNHGFALSDFIYRTPSDQNWSNDHANKLYDQAVRLGLPKISRFLKVDNDTLIKCANAFVPSMCHINFPSCEGTKSQYKEQKICRESCLKVFRSCGKISYIFKKYYVIGNTDPESKKLVNCELPHRNAGDSPECWYHDPESSTGNIWES